MKKLVTLALAASVAFSSFAVAASNRIEFFNAKPIGLWMTQGAVFEQNGKLSTAMCTTFASSTDKNGQHGYGLNIRVSDLLQKRQPEVFLRVDSLLVSQLTSNENVGVATFTWSNGQQTQSNFKWMKIDTNTVIIPKLPPEWVGNVFKVATRMKLDFNGVWFDLSLSGSSKNVEQLLKCMETFDAIIKSGGLRSV